MARYIARDIHDAKSNPSVELLLDLGLGLGHGHVSVAVFHGATGAHLFGALIGALGRKGKDEVWTEDGHCLVSLSDSTLVTKRVRA